MKQLPSRASSNPIVHLAASVALCLASVGHLAAADEPVVPIAERMLVEPILDTPMRAPSICKGPDNTFYLTGTVPDEGPDGTLDWNNGAKIRLWKSSDLKAWEEIGVVFDVTNPGAGGEWANRPRAMSDVADSPRHYLGVTAPEIHYLKDTFWIAYSINGQGTGLLKSTSGMAEGPYVPWSKGPGGQTFMTATGADPSMFQDDDGAVYWLWSPSWIAKLNDDLTALAEPPRMLTCEPRFPGGSDVMVGSHGPFLTKVDGIYQLAVAALNPRFGIHTEDTMVASAKSIDGPYSKAQMMIPHGGQTTVFRDAAGAYRATFCGNDRFAAFRDRPGIVPLELATSFRYIFNQPDRPVLRVDPNRVYTERGPWHKLLPVLDKPGMFIRDMNMIQAPDGYFYFTGSVYGLEYRNKLTIFRSKDLKNWEEIVVRTFADETDVDEAKRNYRTDNIGDWNNYYMDCEIHYIPSQKTFYIIGNAYVGFSVLLRSTTGKGEGPYELIARRGSQSGFFEDDDGTVYYYWGISGLKKLKPDFTGDEKDFGNVTRARGGLCGEDAGCGMVKMHGKYAYFTCGCSTSTQRGVPQGAQNYDFNYLTADSPEGPWSEWMPGIRHGGHGGAFRGLDGHWYGVVWGEDPMFGSYHGKPGMVRLTTELEDGQIIIDIDDDWTPADYVPVSEWKGEGTFSPYTDTAAIEVNHPPVVDAGPDRTVILPANSIALDGAVSDPDSNVTVEWTVADMPTGSSVIFADPYAVDTTATFSSVGTYVLELMADDGLNLPVSDTVTITVNEGGGGSAEVIVDNSDSTGVTFTGSWTASSNVGGFYGSNYLHDDNTGKGQKSVRYTPNLTTGTYDVYIRYTSDPNRASNVPIDITHANGVASLSLDQRTGGGDWVPLGTYAFDSDASGSVFISTPGTVGYVIADAVRFVSSSGGEPFTAWAARMLPTHSSADHLPDANPDGDSNANIVEFVLGTNPGTNDAPAWFKGWMENGQFVFSVDISTTATGVTIGWETSEDLVTWVTADPVATEILDFGGTERRTLRFNLAPEQRRLFLRIKGSPIE